MRADLESRLRTRLSEDGYCFPDYEGYCFANVPGTVVSVLDADEPSLSFVPRPFQTASSRPSVRRTTACSSC